MQLYCERCGPGLFDEPINAISNVVFPVAAWVAWRLARRRNVLTPGLWLLIALAASIGVGSGLWHTFATDWAGALDVWPINLFQLVFLWHYGRSALGIPILPTLGILTGFAYLSYWLTNFDAYLNGSIVYFPTVVMGVLVAIHQWRTRGPAVTATAVSFLTFGVSLVARSIDLLVCRQLPIGTHFLWHVLNGLVVFLALRTVIALRERAKTRANEGAGR